MRRTVARFAVLALSIPLCGCISPRFVGQLPVASPEKIDLNNVELEKVETGVIGQDKCPIFVIVQNRMPSVDEAMRDALKKSGGDLLQNVTITTRFWWIPYIYGRTTLTVQGDVYKVKKASKAAEVESSPPRPNPPRP